jgi:hypothetical protein
MIQEIKQDVEKISVLAELCEDLARRAGSGSDDKELKLRLNVAKEEILKSNYNIKRVLAKIEKNL